MARFSTSLFLLCLIEAIVWAHCATSPAARAPDSEAYLARENKNFKTTPGLDEESPHFHHQESFAERTPEQVAQPSSSLPFASPIAVGGSLAVLLLVAAGIFVVRRLSSPAPVRVIEKADNDEGPSSSDDEQADVIVIGSGIAGSALGAALGADGRDTVVIERDLSEPDRIVGELLQPGGMAALKALGLSDCVEGIESPEVHGYAVIKADGEAVVLPYPQFEGQPRVYGHSFHHGRFVMNLRKAAMNAPNNDVREGTVTELLRKDGRIIGVAYKPKGSTTKKKIYAPLTIVCDGCASNFRRELTDAESTSASRFAGVVLQGECPLPYLNHGHVFLVEPAPVLMYQIGPHETRVLVDLPDSLQLKASDGSMKAYLKEKTAPQLPEKIREKFLEALEKDRVRTMPNSKLPTRPFVQPPGALLLGDSFNMRHPLTGAGMTIALWDAVLVREELGKVRSLDDPAAVAAALKRWHANRWRRACAVNTLAFALYSLFAANDKYPDLEPMRDACFAYFKLGGECVRGPMNLLSIMNAKPHILAAHFFSVAAYGMVRLLLPIPTPARVWRAAKILYSACCLFLPLAFNEHMFSLKYPAYA